MALCVRWLVLAATLAAVVALLLCTSSAPVARAVKESDFTAEQRKNTRDVLQAFGRAIPELGKKWIGNDFCSWKYVDCYSSDVSVWVGSADYAGSLPEMPAGVDYRHVVITLLDFSAMGQRLSGTLPASWSSMTSLATLYLRLTKVSGTLPPQWSSMTSLVSLWLERCERVTGTLPASWSSMTSLSDLNLHGTQVSGSLPPQWSSMTSLGTLYLRLTKVSGSLPPQWRSMRSLNVLDLQGAKVSGSLPSEWSGMKSAEVLQLQDCDLSGSLPSSWSAMPKLKKVALRGNHFCGCVPESWVKKATVIVEIEDEHKGRDCSTERVCPTTAPPQPTTTVGPNIPTTTASPTATPTPAPETECEVDGCEVCEGDSAARCARCREGYFLTSEKTCRADRDGGVAAASSGAAAAAAVCMAVLLSVGLAA
ncbi:surface antigen protein 2 [Leishmania donovani]|uniref:Surface_antigen_protein_2_putative/GeneDB:LmjF.12.0890 n=1 Tax=Leishmania donovani TaxID=5661 RepID=A0A6J8F8P6_LEIDO|nr:surface antigen protein 2 [Leishmania donovani]VDZ42930.1 surface_antigen_protein_2_putative/GeneDB:LmjF.12.0890 [Leishmania donovani]